MERIARVRFSIFNGEDGIAIETLEWDGSWELYHFYPLEDTKVNHEAIWAVLGLLQAGYEVQRY